jgi:orotidine-5'-phosphate decarboxylase
MTFGTRLEAAFAASGHLCVGIDPHPYLLADWGLTDDAAGLREFGLRVVDASVDLVGIVKPQVAFFERHGSAGFAALEDVMGAARKAGLLVIADAKRGDIGSTFDGYAQAWLTPGSPLEADAFTVSTYLGIGSIEGPRDLALENDKGLFVLAATSNPEAGALQTAVQGDGASVAAGIVSEVAKWNGDERLGSVGLVLGATVELDSYGIDAALIGRSPILAPGFGHQGARFDQIVDIYGFAAPNVIVSASRSILAAGPDEIGHAIRSQAAEVAGAFQ